MEGLYQFNQGVTHLLEGFLETAVPMIAGLAEVIGLFIIVTSLTAESGIGGAAGDDLCPAGHDEPAAARGNAGGTPGAPGRGKEGLKAFFAKLLRGRLSLRCEKRKTLT